MRCLDRLLTAALLPVLAAGAASAQQLPFYHGKTVTLISGASGGYDAYAHLITRHMRRHIPGEPLMIARNMPGSASMVAANYLFNVAAPDGLTFGGFVRTIPLAPLTGNKAARYAPERFTWIGTSSRYLDDAYLMMLHKRIGVASLDDLRARKEPVRFGSTGPTSQTDEGSRVVRDVMGLPIRLVRGYQTTPQVMFAVERGEVDGIFIGISSMKAAKPDWLEPASPVTFLMQFGYGGEGRHPAFPAIPRIGELAPSSEAKAILDLLELPFRTSRPFAGPPGIPAEPTRILREAFMRTHTDPEFLAEASKLGLDVSPLSGEDVAALVREAVALPPALLKRYGDLLAAHD